MTYLEPFIAILIVGNGVMIGAMMADILKALAASRAMATHCVDIGLFKPTSNLIEENAMLFEGRASSQEQRLKVWFDGR